jgi:Flp pilus assembly secretin CpaC
LFTAKLAPKSEPAVVVMDAVERAGMECKDGQFDNIVLIIVADAVLNSGIDCRLSQDANIDVNDDNDDVKLNNGTVINDLQFEKARLALLTKEKSNKGTFLNDTHDSNILSVIVTSDVSNKGTT